MNRNNILIFALLQATFTIQEKKFNFPSEIQALMGSCVEIPCTVKTSATEPKNTMVVWHIVGAFFGKRIIYSSNPSEISANYRNRAALIGNPEDSCTLRIHNVGSKDMRTYYPADRKLPADRKVSEYVQLQVTDVPPRPVMSLPEEIIIGRPTPITCSVNHTCATSPPSLNWNLPGWPVKENNIDHGEGNWLATSELTYQPSLEENGSTILCIATFPNGQTSRIRAQLIIKEENTLNRNIRTGIVAACLIPLLLIVFFILRFSLGNRDSKSRAVISYDGKNEYFTVKDPKDTGYTDLIEREKTMYCVLEPKNRMAISAPNNQSSTSKNLSVQGKNNLKQAEYVNIYETLT
ncbi:B-cell receptor CD22-like isoform X2 [Pyxicephalus adspersus]|uniref:B-cell receptor CD22-like isoform X2 n=1 Tax=Pyxicephalus adspersus TaxID=30357 RepID=UPI003B59F5C0